MSWRARALVPVLTLVLAVSAAVVGVDAARAHAPVSAHPRVAIPSKPNVIVVMTDDMRQDDLRYMPNVDDLLVEGGTEFMNSFSPYPLCCPARTSFLTGEFAHNHGVYSNRTPFGFGALDDSYTVGTAMQDAGYNTALIGKYLNKYGKVKSKVTGRSSVHYVPAGWNNWQVALGHNPKAGVQGDVYDYYNTTWNRNGRLVNTKGRYSTNVIGKASRKVAKKMSASSKPFFMWITYVAPHDAKDHEAGDPTKLRTPSRPKSVRGLYDDVITKAPGLALDGSSQPDVRRAPAFTQKRKEPKRKLQHAIVQLTRQRAEALRVVDRQVGRLVSTLKRTGAWSNTVLIFTSDNGFYLGEHRKPSGKVITYDPALRVPLVVAGAGVPVGERRYDPISTVDLTATITALGGASSPMAAHHTPDGTSRVGVIRDGDDGWTRPQLTESVTGNVRNWDKAPGMGIRNQIGIRTARYQYTRNAGDVTELYDLKSDPNELDNVAGTSAYDEVQDDLSALWTKIKDCRGTGCTPELPQSLSETAASTRALTLGEFAGITARTGLPWR